MKINMKIKQNYRKVFFSFLISFYLIGINNYSLKAQNNYIINHKDSTALNEVFVEKYYVADSSDYIDTTGGALPKGSVTYRIYIGMKPGYKLQMVYGSPTHELVIETSTRFYNDPICRAETGFNIDMKQINKASVALDSWITMGAAARGFTGIPLSEDTADWSWIKRPSLNKKDGFTKWRLPNFNVFNLDLSFFADSNKATKFAVNNGGWAALGGVNGPKPSNRVLIAQLTTNGKLSFKLNVQIGTPTGGFVKFVATDPLKSEIEFKGLTLNQQ
jgi:hypothetical protein